MPPGQTVPTGLSFSAAKKICTPQDFERLAAAFLSATETVNYDADKAARDFGGGKADSFKRSIWVITKKIKEYNEKMGDGEAADSDEAPAPKPAKAKGGGRKRKAASEDDGEEGGRAKKKGGRGGKKVNGKGTSDAASSGAGEDHAVVKAENGLDDDDEDFLR